MGWILSEGDKRDSKHGLASHDFAPKPASGTRPGRIYGMCSFGGHIKPVQLERVNAAGWDGHVFLGRSQIRPKPALLDQQVLGMSNMTSGETGAVPTSGSIA